MSFPSTTSCCPASTHDIITSFPRSLVICLRVLRHSVIMLSTTSWVVLKQKDHSNAVPLLHSFVLASMVSYVTFVVIVYYSPFFLSVPREGKLCFVNVAFPGYLHLYCYVWTRENCTSCFTYMYATHCVKQLRLKKNVLGSLVCHICDSKSPSRSKSPRYQGLCLLYTFCIRLRTIWSFTAVFHFLLTSLSAVLLLIALIFTFHWNCQFHNFWTHLANLRPICNTLILRHPGFADKIINGDIISFAYWVKLNLLEYNFIIIGRICHKRKDEL